MNNKALGIVPYLTRKEAGLLIEAAKKGRKGERGALLIQVLYQTGLRISEALFLSPSKIRQFEGRPALEVIGKGRKLRMVACPERLSEKLQAYAYQEKLEAQANLKEAVELYLESFGTQDIPESMSEVVLYLLKAIIDG